ncbi:transposase [Burkholderia sp. Bp9140]|uniref:transposase n=1 Tax=Burkholderia sp. Bp9140 TaxID=2184572 RepID=UPI003908B83A
MPQQHTTGSQPRLPGITKRGNSYLRRLFVQGARALRVWKDKHATIRSCAGSSDLPNAGMRTLQSAHWQTNSYALHGLLSVMRSGAEFNLHYHT